MAVIILIQIGRRVVLNRPITDSRLMARFALASLGLMLTVSREANAEPPVTIDGRFSDWALTSAAYTDAFDDADVGDLGFRRLWIRDNERFLFLRLELDQDIDLGEGNGVRLFLDTDGDAASGVPIHGIGADLEWNFGPRFGIFHVNGLTFVQHEDIRFRAEPTVTARVFEIAIGRDTLPNGVDPLFPGGEIRLVIDDQFGSDQLPDAGQTLTYTLDQSVESSVEPLPLERLDATDLRLVTYNVLFDSPWNPGLTARFGTQLSAVAPDIINFQEIFNHDLEETTELVESWLPSGPEEAWHGASNGDCHTLSRYNVLDAWPLDNNLAVLLDTTEVLDTLLLIINVHLPCCENDAGRVVEIDRILSFLRDVLSPGGAVDVPTATAIVFTGDTNLVGQAGQLDSILGGDVIDEQNFGPDFAPDWDGTSLSDLISRQTHKAMAYTWTDGGSSFWPGHLDYFIYSDSVIEPGRHFVLYTPEMPDAVLAQHGLNADDSLASDHLLVCADFRARAARGQVPAAGHLALVLLAVFLCVAAVTIMRRRRLNG